VAADATDTVIRAHTERDDAAAKKAKAERDSAEAHASDLADRQAAARMRGKHVRGWYRKRRSWCSASRLRILDP
jgi:hypothetical protein